MLLGIAAVLLVLTAMVHSLLGERFILRRLAKLENLPRLSLGGHEMMRPVLRFAWHITSFFMLGFAAQLALMSADAVSAPRMATVIGILSCLRRGFSRGVERAAPVLGGVSAGEWCLPARHRQLGLLTS